MTAFNVVRFKVRPGSEQQFIEAHRVMRPGFKGFVAGNMIKTGDQTFCFVGEWRNFQSIVNARPQMVSMLDQVRAFLEEFSPDLGVTDPVSGESVLKIATPKKAPKKRAKAGKTPKRAGKSAKKTARKGAKKRTARKR